MRNDRIFIPDAPQLPGRGLTVETLARLVWQWMSHVKSVVNHGLPVPHGKTHSPGAGDPLNVKGLPLTIMIENRQGLGPGFALVDHTHKLNPGRNGTVLVHDSTEETFGYVAKSSRYRALTRF